MSFGRDSHGIEGLSLDSVPLQPYRQESCPACNANPVWKQATLDALDGYSQGTKVSAEHLVAAMVSRVGSKKKNRDLLEECQPAPKWVYCRVGPKAAL